MYQKYKTYINSPVNKERMLNQLKSEVSDWTPSEQVVKIELVNEFCYNHKTYTFKIEDGIFNDFSLEGKLEVLDHWLTQEGSFPMNEDVTKMIYQIWPQYMNGQYTWKNPPKSYPHTQIFRHLFSIKSCLRDFHRGNNISEMRALLLPQKVAYPHYNLLGLLPLMGEEGMEIFAKVSKMRYDDGQDCLMFGLAHFPVKEFLPILRQTFQCWDTHGNISFCGSTGMLGELEHSIDIWKEKGFDFWSDPVLVPILIKNAYYMWKIAPEKYPKNQFYHLVLKEEQEMEEFRRKEAIRKSN